MTDHPTQHNITAGSKLFTRIIKSTNSYFNIYNLWDKLGPYHYLSLQSYSDQESYFESLSQRNFGTGRILKHF